MATKRVEWREGEQGIRSEGQEEMDKNWIDSNIFYYQSPTESPLLQKFF